VKFPDWLRSGSRGRRRSGVDAGVLYMAPGEALEAARRVFLSDSDLVDVQSFFALMFDGPEVERTSDGLAIVRVVGTLYRGMFWSDYDDLRDQLSEALEDASVKGVILDIDSPGGTVSGLFDLSRFIRQARGTKPIWALANDQATSAAYALGSAADRFYGSPSAVVGSIGALATHIDLSKREREVGITYSEIASGSHKTDLSPHRPLSDAGRARLEQLVNTAANRLFADVSGNRVQLSVDVLRQQQAAVYIGQEAIDVGLVDGLLSLDELREQMLSELTPKASGAGSAPAQPPKLKAETAAGDPTVTQHPTTPETGGAPAAPAAPGAPAAPATPAPPAAPATPAAPAPAAAADPLAEHLARSRQIMSLCELAGHPELAAGWIVDNVSAEAARERLLALRSSIDPGEISGHHSGPTPAGAPVSINAHAVHDRWNDPEKLRRPASR
jgi:signal peptide peptidase SppA